MNEGKVIKTAVHIKCQLNEQKNSRTFVFVDFHLYCTGPDTPMGAY